MKPLQSLHKYVFFFSFFVSYWREITLVYDKKEFRVVLPGSVVQRLEEGGK